MGPACSAWHGHKVCGKLCSSEQWLSESFSRTMRRDSGKLACPARPIDPLGRLSQGDAGSFLGALQDQGAAAERTLGTRNRLPWEQPVCLVCPPHGHLETPSPAPGQRGPPRGATMAPGVPGCPGASGDSSSTFVKRWKEAAQRGLWTTPTVQLARRHSTSKEAL